MRRPPRILALDFGASHVAAAVFAMSKAGQLLLEHYAVEEYAVGDDIVEETSNRALARLAEKVRWRGPCVIAVPAHLALVKVVSIPAVAPTQRSQVLAFEAAQSIPYPLGEVCWDSYYLGTVGSEDRFVMAAIKAEAMAALCSSAAAVDLAPEEAMPGNMALWHAWRHQYGNATDSALLVDIGARSTQVVFAMQRSCFARTLPLGGNVITREIMAELDLEFSQAEALKVKGLGGQMLATENPAAHARVTRAAATFGHRLQQELARAILGYARQPGAIEPTQILLTGGGAQGPELAAMLNRKLLLPVTHYDPRMKVAGATASGPSMVVLTGLAAAMLADETQPLNLLPATAQKAVSARKARPWWLAAAALLVLAVLPPAWHFHVLARELRAENARLESRLEPLRVLLARNLENEAKLAALSKEIASLRRLAVSKTSWPAFFAGLQRDLASVGDVWLDRLLVIDGDVAGQHSETGEASPLRLAVSGRLLDTRNPLSKVSPDSYQRVKDLFARIKGSPFVQGLEDERFDNNQAGILRFDFTVVINPEDSL